MKKLKWSEVKESVLVPMADEKQIQDMNPGNLPSSPHFQPLYPQGKDSPPVSL